ncbi:MAG TPA: hypothetical protein VFK85_01690 [Anaeromyxobacteraceae bacterium]|nr:hypothetical protein [Anaeromyxobacteraceae bacterium]
MKPLQVVYQAYGLPEIRIEALYAAWSALAHAGDSPLVVHVYTDEPAVFRGLDSRIEVHALAPERIREWRGPCDFTHRLKAMMIQDLATRRPTEPLLYLDGDTFFVGPLAGIRERIGPGRAVMHEREYSVAASQTGQMKKFRAHMGPLSFDGGPIDLDGDMWNAGAIGLDPEQFPLVGRWISFVDEVYPHYRHGLVEQYAVSLILQRAAKLAACDDLVFHYWFQKDEYDAAIRADLDRIAAMPFEDALAYVRANRIALPPPAKKRSERKGFWARLLGR